MTELARKRPAPPHGEGPAVLPPLLPGNVLVLVVRRVGSKAGVAGLVLETIRDDDGSYVEELMAAWDLVVQVATEVHQGRRNLGGEKPR
jgi:hypothetical protein